LIKIKSSDAVVAFALSSCEIFGTRIGYAELQYLRRRDLISINFAGAFRANVFASTRGGLLDETTEGRATVTADACVRASAQWLLTNGTPGAA